MTHHQCLWHCDRTTALWQQYPHDLRAIRVPLSISTSLTELSPLGVVLTLGIATGGAVAALWLVAQATRAVVTTVFPALLQVGLVVAFIDVFGGIIPPPL